MFPHLSTKGIHSKNLDLRGLITNKSNGFLNGRTTKVRVPPPHIPLFMYVFRNQPPQIFSLISFEVVGVVYIKKNVR